MQCRWIRDELTAHADGELRGWRAAWVRRHLSRCADCGREAAVIERSVARQRRVLPALVQEPVEADDLWRRVRVRLDDSPRTEPEPRERRWAPTRRLVLAAAAACVLVAVLLARPLDPWLIAVGIEDPPRPVAEKPELFVDYPLFEHLDAIEQLDRLERKGGAQERGRQRG
jgi:anti-sigma factor RsiW